MRHLFVAFVILITTISTSNAISASTLSTQKPVEGELFSETVYPELYCMALNIYHEARADHIAGQYAVADVVLNRVEDTRYPNSICEVIKQAKYKESWKTKQDPNLEDNNRKYIPIRNKCQFSWWCDGKSDQAHDSDSWRKAQEIAYRIVQQRKYRGISEGSTHYHATYVSPRWASDFDLVGRIGDHIFYRWP